ncbi:MAG: hypothetical protein ACT4OS_09075 [Acidimicrobiales bacterium]
MFKTVWCHPSGLPVMGMVAGTWALLPAFSGPALATARRVEIADHVIPGVILLAVSATVLAVTARHALPATILLSAGLAVVLCGLWMTLTHLPLAVLASKGQAPWAATVYHTAPGLAILAVGIVWARRFWSEAA